MGYAISLCKQDVAFARKLVRAINPNLRVFFYEDKQDELISKSGAEAFANTFKEKSRIVVILSREEWSRSYYTEIERNAIIDRTTIKGEGYQFLMVMPMESGEIPSWYPSTRIYANPFRFDVKDLARFIEFKVSELGGIVKPLTLEDRYQNLLNRIKVKGEVIKLQENEEAIQEAQNEKERLKKCFNNKIKYLNKSLFDKSGYSLFMSSVNNSYFSMGEYVLECKILIPSEVHDRIVTTQDFCLQFEISKLFGNGESKKLVEKEQRLFLYTGEINGWALPNLDEQASR